MAKRTALGFVGRVPPHTNEPCAPHPSFARAPEPDADELVRQGLPLVGHLVREMSSRVPTHVPREDLMSAGMLALVQAAKGYQADRGTSFFGYASTRIRGAIVDELRGMDWASRSVRRRARQLEDARERVTAELGRSATDAEVAAALGVGLSEVAAHKTDVARASVMSLHGFEDGSLEEVLPSSGPTPVEVLEGRERIAYLHDAIEELPERLRVVVEGYFFGEQPMAQIAEKLGVSESRVSQLRAEAVSLLKEALNRALQPEQATPHARPDGCAARRREAYFAEVASHRTFTARLAEPTRGTYSA